MSFSLPLKTWNIVFHWKIRKLTYCFVSVMIYTCDIFASVILCRIIYSYPSKWRWIVEVIYREAKRRRIHLALWTDPEGDSCVTFSIYQISWIKIKKELSLNKRRHLEFAYVSIDIVSGIIFYDFVSISLRKFFSVAQ